MEGSVWALPPGCGLPGVIFEQKKITYPGLTTCSDADDAVQAAEPMAVILEEAPA